MITLAILVLTGATATTVVCCCVKPKGLCGFSQKKVQKSAEEEEEKKKKKKEEEDDEAEVETEEQRIARLAREQRDREAAERLAEEQRVEAERVNRLAQEQRDREQQDAKDLADAQDLADALAAARAEWSQVSCSNDMITEAIADPRLTTVSGNLRKLRNQLGGVNDLTTDQLKELTKTVDGDWQRQSPIQIVNRLCKEQERKEELKRLERQRERDNAIVKKFTEERNEREQLAEKAKEIAEFLKIANSSVIGGRVKGSLHDNPVAVQLFKKFLMDFESQKTDPHVVVLFMKTVFLMQASKLEEEQRQNRTNLVNAIPENVLVAIAKSGNLFSTTTSFVRHKSRTINVSAFKSVMTKLGGHANEMKSAFSYVMRAAAEATEASVNDMLESELVKKGGMTSGDVMRVVFAMKGSQFNNHSNANKMINSLDRACAGYDVFSAIVEDAKKWSSEKVYKLMDLVATADTNFVNSVNAMPRDLLAGLLQTSGETGSNSVENERKFFSILDAQKDGLIAYKPRDREA